MPGLRGKGLTVDNAGGHRFRLGTFIVRAIVKTVFIIVTVEIIQNQCGGNALKIATTVEKLL